MDYQWITFDCYGTLIDWQSGICSAFDSAAKKAGVPFDRKRLLQLYARYEAEEEQAYQRYRDVLTRVARRICVELGIRTTHYDFLVESLPRWRPFPDTNSSLERLAKKCKLGILSNIDNDLIAETRKHFTVPFELIVTAEHVASYKPSPRHFLEARRKIGNIPWIHAAQSFFHDIVPCSRLGIDNAWINRTQEAATDTKVRTVCETRDLAAFAKWMGDGSGPYIVNR